MVARRRQGGARIITAYMETTTIEPLTRQTPRHLRLLSWITNRWLLDGDLVVFFMTI